MAQKKLFKRPEVRYLKNALLINKEILVIGDLHLGYEDKIVSAAILPNVQLREMFSEFDEIFKRLNREKVEVKEIVLLGDLKHDFASISDSEWRDVTRLIDYLVKRCEKLVVIKGNHDMKLNPILRKKGIEMKDYYMVRISDSTTLPNISNIKNKREAKSEQELGLSDTKKKSGDGGRNIWFLHGHGVFKQVFGQGLTVRQTNRQTDRQDILIIGHLHPSISLSDSYKKERYKCFLKGNWNGFVVYILPSFSSVGFGYDIRNLGLEKLSRSGKKIRKHDFFIIPDKDLMKFNVVVYDECGKKGLGFGKVKKLVG